MKTPRKHAELIKLWADGAEIEYRIGDRWYAFKNDYPNWCNDIEYRIKPEPKPDVVSSVAVRHSSNYGAILIASTLANLCLTFDGETGKLKKAEVLE